ncbi:MAG: DUF1311 domain-containing protein [Paracoccaceae bacterium]|nr:MAG: DUF1311 domain-containing protein [Paracoccaceae bacterium]
MPRAPLRHALAALALLSAAPAAAQTGTQPTVPPPPAASLMADLPPPDPRVIAAAAACVTDSWREAALACADETERACYDAPGGFQPCHRANITAWEVVRLQLLGRKLADFDAADARRPPGGPLAGETLRIAEQAFAAFREADCASDRAAWPPGSSEGEVVAVDCLFRHTVEQTARLMLRGVP